MRRTITAVSALAIGTLVLSACGNGGADTGDPAAEATAPDTSEVCTEDRVGGEIVVGEYAMLTSFAPGQGGYGVFGGAQSAAVFDRLMRWDPGAEEFVPQLAESLESNEDNTAWTLTLPEGITFSNGEELTAEDVVFTLGLHQDPGLRSMALSEAMNVETVEAENPLTVRYTLTEPWANFPMLLAGVAGEVIPEETYQATDPGEWARNPVGAGAFLVENYIPDQETVLVPNPDYHAGVVCPTLRFTHISGGQGTLDALSTGELQVGFLRGAEFVADAKGQGVPGYESTDSAGRVVNMNSGSGGYDGVLTDERARRAISHAIDRDLFDDRMTGGVGQPTSALLAESSRFYDGADGLPYDPELATELLDEVRADHPEWDGSLDMLLIASPENQESGILIQSMLGAVGIDVRIESVPVSQNTARVLRGDYELSISGLSTSDADPSAAFVANLTPGGQNRTGIDDPALTEAALSTKIAPDFEAQVDAYRNLQEVFNEVQPFAVLASAEQYIAVNDTVSGVFPTVNSTVLYDKAYVEQ